MSHLRELKHRTNSKQNHWCDYQYFLLSSHGSPQPLKFYIIFLCWTHRLSCFFHNLPFLLQRSNQFSLKTDSCWYGSDYVTNVNPVSSFFLFNLHVRDSCWLKYIRSNHFESDTFWSWIYYSVSTTTSVICVGYFHRSNRRLAMRAGFSTVLFSNSC